MRLDEVLGQLPWGLHDAHLLSVEMDWLAQQARLLLAAPTDQNQRHDRLAQLVLSGVKFFVADSPRGEPGRHADREVPWIDGGLGPVDEAAARRLPPVPEGYFLLHLYTREPWQDFHLCAREAALFWLEDAEAPYSSGWRDDLLPRVRQALLRNPSRPG